MEYINKAELKQAVRNKYKDIETRIEVNCIVNEMPTIDIVRCYKCKHYEKYTEHTGLCNHFVVNGERLAMEYDWFCADGERR